MTTDDVILAGYAAQAEYKGKLKVVGKGFSDERYGVGLQEGRHRDGEQGQRRAEAVHRRRVLEESLDATVGPSGYTIPTRRPRELSASQTDSA